MFDVRGIRASERFLYIWSIYISQLLLLLFVFLELKANATNDACMTFTFTFFSKVLVKNVVLYCISPFLERFSQHESIRCAPDYSIDTVSELTRRSAIGNCD